MNCISCPEALTATEQQLSGTLGIAAESLYANSADWTNIALQKAGTWKENLDKLKDWYQWQQASGKLNELGLGFIAEKYKEKEYPYKPAPEWLPQKFLPNRHCYIIGKEPTLELFNGKIFNDIIAKYKQVSANFENITKKELFAKLASNIPSIFTHEAIQSSEVGILQKEHTQQCARHIHPETIRPDSDLIATYVSLHVDESHICCPIY